MTAMKILGAKASPPPPQTPQVHEMYPMVMVHPHARKAESHGVPGTEIRDRAGNVIGYGSYRGQGDFMPPVTVMNADQAMQHHALGYRPGGTSDVAAFANLTAGAVVQVKAPERYPMWCCGELVNNEAEEQVTLARHGKLAQPPLNPPVPAHPSAESAPEETADAPRPTGVYGLPSFPAVSTARHEGPSRKGHNRKRQGWSPERRAAFEARKAAT